VGICRERAAYEGQGAVELEAQVDRELLGAEDRRLDYPFAIPRLKDGGLPYVEPLPMWNALLGDLILDTPVPVIAARFHKGLARVIARMVDKLARSRAQNGPTPMPIRHVALSGGVFQNRVLLELVADHLRALDYIVLTHRQVPSNDGGLALGQAAIAAAQFICHHQGVGQCV
jgi:hydrogenase maturation protein HypF